MRETGAWLGLFVLAILLIAAGVRGQLGLTVAVIFTPDMVSVE